MISVTNDEELLKYLEIGFSDMQSLSEVNISLDMFSLNLKITGNGYQGSITPPVMKALLILQDSLYRAYRETTDESLSKKEKLKLDMIVRIEKGSSNILVSFVEQFDIIKEALKNMSGNQITISFIATAMIIASIKIGSAFFDYLGKKYKDKIELQKQKLTNEKDIKLLDILSNVLEHNSNDRVEILKTIRNISKNNTIEIDNNKLDTDIIKKRIEEIPPIVDTTETKVIEDDFIVKTMRTNLEIIKGKMDIENINTKEIMYNVELQARLFYDNSNKILQQSKNKESIRLRLIVTTDKGKVERAILDKIL